MRRHLLEALLVAGLCVGFAVAQAPSLSDPYFADAIYYVAPSARDISLDPFHPIPEGYWDNGHPPLVFWILAALWRIFGNHLWVSHALILVSALSALLLTWRLGRILFGPATGVSAAVLLAVHPAFFYTSRTVTIDIPLLAFALLCLEAALRGRWTTAVLAGCAMALTKETAIAFLPAIALGAVFLPPVERRPSWTRAGALIVIPALALAAWLAVHRVHVGWWIRQDQSRALKFTPGALLGLSYAHQIWTRTFEPFLINHGQWAGVLLIAASLAFDWLSRRKRPAARTAWILAGVWLVWVLPMGVFLAAIRLYLPRYMLSAIAIGCVLAAWAASRWGRAAPFLAGAVALSLLLGHQGSWTPGWETNRSYIDVLTLERRAAQYLEREHPTARVAGIWPFVAELCDPFYGYVTKPMRVVGLSSSGMWGAFCPPGTFSPIPFDRITADDFDFLFVGPVAASRGGRMGLEKRLELHEVARLDQNGYQVIFYSPRLPTEPPRLLPATAP